MLALSYTGIGKLNKDFRKSAKCNEVHRRYRLWSAYVALKREAEHILTQEEIGCGLECLCSGEVVIVHTKCA